MTLNYGGWSTVAPPVPTSLKSTQIRYRKTSCPKPQWVLYIYIINFLIWYWNIWPCYFVSYDPFCCQKTVNFILFYISFTAAVVVFYMMTWRSL